MFGLGVSEIAVIMIVALVVFGPEKLPEFARTLGRTAGYFRRTMDELRHELTLDPPPPPSSRTAESRLVARPSSSPQLGTEEASTPTTQES